MDFDFDKFLSPEAQAALNELADTAIKEDAAQSGSDQANGLAFGYGNIHGAMRLAIMCYKSALITGFTPDQAMQLTRDFHSAVWARFYGLTRG